MLYLPIIIIAIHSLNENRSVYDFTNVTFHWYTDLFSNLINKGELYWVIRNTLLIAFLSTAISTVLGTLFAIGIHSMTKKKRQRMVMLNQIPILNADIVTGISLMLIFKLFMVVFPNIFGLTTMLLAHVFFSIPYVVLSVLPKLSELDVNLFDAALDLGCKPTRGMRKVIIPAISSGIFTGMLIAFTMSIDDFVISYFTTGNGFDNVSIFIYAGYRLNMSPEIYAYNTLLSFTVVFLLIGVYVFGSFKKRRELKIKSNFNRGAV
ncbi:MAG: ABC transporter permease [Firmicutes bacterium]|nr:ABC transporter permease [Bacillota bacterium]